MLKYNIPLVELRSIPDLHPNVYDSNLSGELYTAKLHLILLH